MSEFIVSARKYRPNSFETVVGQESITKTLENAIASDKLAQAYLFCGPRGVGKTTCARIFSKKINQINDEEDATDYSYNIFELDAASNNSVDDIRSLTDQVRIPPQVGKYKVYIIDEVHMLSQAAFNAFLKTLEEPPKHAIFILATTEKHKIIPTILSRCQIYDFNRIQSKDIINHLEKIAQREEIAYENDALHIIAQKADGGLRDALSIFDQLVSSTQSNLTYDNVIENLNVLDYNYYFKIVDEVIAKNISGCLLAIDEIIDKGFDGHNFINGLASHLRDLMVVKDPATIKLIEVSDNIRDKYLEQSKNIGIKDIIYGLNTLSEADVNYKTSKNPRLLIELSMIRMCSPELGEQKKNEVTPTEKKKSAESVSKEVKPVSVQSENSTYNTSSDKIIEEVKTEEKLPLKRLDETPPPPTTKKRLGRLNANKSSLSINSLLNPEEKKADNSQENEIINTSREAFSFDLLMGVWKKYALIIKESIKPSFYATLTSRKPILKSPEHVVIQVDNQVQELDFVKEKPDLLDYLRKELNNYSIQLDCEIIQKNEAEMIYSTSDKFKHLSKKNPALLLLKDKLDLDLEY